MATYVAFLRGIGGTDTKIKMQVLKQAFEEMGFQNVKTVIASGNVIFDAKPASEKKLERRIEKALPGAIGFESDTFVFTLDELQRLRRSSLVKEMKGISKSRPFVTFLKEPPKNKVTFSGKGFKIVGRKGRAVLSVSTPSETAAPDLMRLLDQKLGKKTTTRSWLTIGKILEK